MTADGDAQQPCINYKTGSLLQLAGTITQA